MRDDVKYVLERIALPSNAEKRDHVEAVVIGMLTRSMTPTDGEIPAHPVRTMTPDEVVRNIEDWGLNDWNMPLAWVRRDGFVLPAADTRHEYLLHFIGLDARTVEDQGWARISNSGWQCMYRVTPQQRKTLKARGCVVENAAEREKPVWHGLPPFDETVPKARRVRR